MLLAINIGNSNTAAGLFEGPVLLGTSVSPTGEIVSAASAATLVTALRMQHGGAEKAIAGCVISSVVPEQTAHWMRYAEQTLNKQPLVVSGALPLGLTIHYDNPSTMGSDRICAAVAAFDRYAGRAIIADFGTASTYTVIDRDGNILGGAIAPGIVTAAQELYRRTAQLKRVGFTPPSKVIGESTKECMESGIFYSGMDAAEGMIQRLIGLSGVGTPVIATGGLGPMVAAFLPLVTIVEPNLVLQGARLIYERVKKTKL